MLGVMRLSSSMHKGYCSECFSRSQGDMLDMLRGDSSADGRLELGRKEQRGGNEVERVGWE